MQLKSFQIPALTLSAFLYWQQIIPPVLGQTTDNNRLSRYETVVLGQTRDGRSEESRLADIEKQIFGKSQKGTFNQRLDAIGKLVEGKSTSNYFPPIPPVMDRSEFAKEPVPAPKGLSDNANYEQAAGQDRGAQLPDVASSDDRVHGMLRQAMALYSRGKVADAQKIYQQVLAIDFHNGDANFNLGAIAEDKGDLQSAAKYYSAASAANPSDREVADALKGVQTKLKNQPAPQPQIAFQETENSAALKQIADDAAASFKKGNFDEAIAKLNYLARKNPYDANTQFALGQAYRAKGNEAEALKHLRAAVTLNPKNDLYMRTANEAEQHNQRAVAANNDPTPAGQITPFQGIPTSERRGTAYDGIGMGSGSIGGSGLTSSQVAQLGGFLMQAMPLMTGSVQSYGYGYPGGGMMAPVGGLGGLGGLGGMSSYGYGYPAYGVGGTRISRMMRSALTGAAMGAVQNRGNPGGSQRGAVYGGLYGLMTGGY